jgi:DNA-binding transcriptional LysR family regulator
MSALRYSFSQIEAFACVAGSGSLSKAALLLGKDRTTVRDLLDYLEDALGYTLFVRQGRTLILTEQGQQLHRQAHLLLRQAQAFESYAQSLPDAERQELVMVYDPFVSPAFIEAVIVEMAKKGLCFSAWSASREEAEAALKSGKAQVAVCQANYRALGTDMEWRALGNIGLDFYASAQLFQHQQRPLTLLNLSLIPQVVMHKAHTTSKSPAVCKYPGKRCTSMNVLPCATCWKTHRAGDSYRHIFRLHAGKPCRRWNVKWVIRGWTLRWSRSGNPARRNNASPGH